MAAKKGEVPAHVKKKKFSHPNTQHPVICILDKVENLPYIPRPEIKNFELD